MLLLGGRPADSAAGDSVIGVIFASGEFFTNGYEVRGSSSLVNESAVDTLASPVHIFLGNNGRLDLAADSRALVSQSQAVLENGSIQSRGSYLVRANQVSIRSTGLSDFFRVSVSANSVRVSVLSGKIEVKNSREEVITRMLAVQNLLFTVQKSGIRISAEKIGVPDVFYGGYPYEIGTTKF